MVLPRSLTDREQAKFRDTGDVSETLVAVTFDGIAQPVVITNSALTKTNRYNEINAVAPAVQTNILSFTPGSNIELSSIEVDGDNIATYEVLINGTIEAKINTYYTKLNHNFFFENLNITSGQAIVVRVTNNSTGSVSFRARMLTNE